jgi:hypothetical protein
VSCKVHTSGRTTPQDGPCIDCRNHELRLLALMLRSERNLMLRLRESSPAFRSWRHCSEMLPPSPDRWHPERKLILNGHQKENTGKN